MPIRLRLVTAQEASQEPPPPRYPIRKSVRVDIDRSKNPYFQKELRLKGVETTKRNGIYKLTHRQALFVAELIADPGRNVIRAATRAGYSGPSRYNLAYQMMQYPKIKKAIEEADKKIFAKLEITHETVLQHIANIAFANPLDYYSDVNKGEIDLSKISRQQALAIQEITPVESTGKVKIKLADKLSALALLGRHLKLWDGEVNKNTLTVNFVDRLMQGRASVNDLGDIGSIPDWPGTQKGIG